MSFGLIGRPLAFNTTTTTAALAGGTLVSDIGTVQPREAVAFGESPAAIDIDLGVARSVNLIGLIAAQADSWEVAAADTQAGLDTGALAIASAIPNPGWRGVSAVFYDGVVRSKRWWRLTLSGTPDISAGRLVLADAFEPSHSFTHEGVRGRAPGLVFDETAGGAVYPDTDRPQRRRWGVNFDDVTDDEYRLSLDSLDDYTAGGGEVLFVRNTTLPAGARETDSLYGLMSLAEGVARQRKNRWRAAITLEELI